LPSAGLAGWLGRPSITDSVISARWVNHNEKPVADGLKARVSAAAGMALVEEIAVKRGHQPDALLPTIAQ
jgi:hypothetical protein